CARDSPKQALSKVRNLTIEYAWTDGQSERLSALAAELVGRHVAVIVSSSLNATYAAKAATSTIPVVFAVNNDPVATGLVASLNRPGGNLTGVAYLTGELGAKRLGLMHEIVPSCRLCRARTSDLSALRAVHQRREGGRPHLGPAHRGLQRVD